LLSQQFSVGSQQPFLTNTADCKLQAAN